MLWGGPENCRTFRRRSQILSDDGSSRTWESRQFCSIGDRADVRKARGEDGLSNESAVVRMKMPNACNVRLQPGTELCCDRCGGYARMRVRKRSSIPDRDYCNSYGGGTWTVECREESIGGIGAKRDRWCMYVGR